MVSVWMLLTFVLGQSPLGQDVEGIFLTEQQCQHALSVPHKNRPRSSSVCIEVKMLEGQKVYNSPLSNEYMVIERIDRK